MREIKGFVLTWTFLTLVLCSLAGSDYCYVMTGWKDGLSELSERMTTQTEHSVLPFVVVTVILVPKVEGVVILMCNVMYRFMCLKYCSPASGTDLEGCETFRKWNFGEGSKLLEDRL